MTAVLVIVHVLSCVFLVVVVLLQTGKGAEMGAVFGGSSQTVFGSSGAGNFLTHTTTAIAAVFMLTSLSLTYLGGRQTATTVMDEAPAAAPLAPQALPPAPAEPGAEKPPAAPAPAEAPQASQPDAPAAPGSRADSPQAAAPAGQAGPAEAGEGTTAAGSAGTEGGAS